MPTHRQEAEQGRLGPIASATVAQLGWMRGVLVVPAAMPTIAAFALMQNCGASGAGVVRELNGAQPLVGSLSMSDIRVLQSADDFIALTLTARGPLRPRPSHPPFCFPLFVSSFFPFFPLSSFFFPSLSYVRNCKNENVLAPTGVACERGPPFCHSAGGGVPGVRVRHPRARRDRRQSPPHAGRPLRRPELYHNHRRRGGGSTAAAAAAWRPAERR